MTKNRIATIPYQRAKLDELGLSLGECESAVQYVNKSRKFAGHKAIAQGLIDSRTIWSPLGRILLWPVISGIAFVVYGLVAKNRHRLPGGTPACSLDGR
jgi:hypothetical protein